MSQGIKVGGPGTTLFIAGQVALNMNGELVGRGNFAAQARQALGNLKDMVEAGGGCLADVVKLTFYLTDMAHFEILAPIRHEFFGPKIPPSTVVGTPALGVRDLLLEIDATAFVPAGRV
jgi:2-iminobutanoate/2-iminopropanoate deaminase